MKSDFRMAVWRYWPVLAVFIAVVVLAGGIAGVLMTNDQRVASGKKAKLYRELKERAVYDFACCAFEPNGIKATTVDDVKIVRALPAIKRFEVQICERESHWYNCDGFWCWLEKRPDRTSGRQ